MVPAIPHKSGYSPCIENSSARQVPILCTEEREKSQIGTCVHSWTIMYKAVTTLCSCIKLTPVGVNIHTYTTLYIYVLLFTRCLQIINCQLRFPPPFPCSPISQQQIHLLLLFLLLQRLGGPEANKSCRPGYSKGRLN